MSERTKEKFQVKSMLPPDGEREKISLTIKRLLYFDGKTSKTEIEKFISRLEKGFHFF